MNTRIGILGAGGWGTALAILFESKGYNTTLWEYNKNFAESIITARENKALLPGVRIPETIHITTSLYDAVRDREYVVLAIPSHTVRATARELNSMDFSEITIISGVKGIENQTLCRMSEVIKQELNGVREDQIVAISGPSHAEEVARKIPTAVVAACESPETAQKVQELCITQFFRVYSGTDVLGVELGGALKNIIAIAAGICDGIGTGINTKAALLTRGMAEISRLGIAMGAQQATFSGLAGIGDLIVTCMSGYSRNRFVGEEIGKGRNLKEIITEMVKVAEGVRTTESAFELSELHQTETPIMHQVYQVLFRDKNPRDAIRELMTRQPKEENWT